MNNLILIGMPGAGKSTVGVVLAKIKGFNFVDTDLVIQQSQGKVLQETINECGIEQFKLIEDLALTEINVTDSVISTGGSAVYAENGMKHLKQIGKVIYLKLNFDEINKRINNVSTRGLVMKEGFTLKDMFDERLPLYEKYADITIDCNDLDLEAVVDKIISLV